MDSTDLEVLLRRLPTVQEGRRKRIEQIARQRQGIPHGPAQMKNTTSARDGEIGPKWVKETIAALNKPFGHTKNK